MTHRLSPRQRLLHDGVNRIHNLSERQRIAHICLVSNSSSTPPVMNPLDKDGDGVLDQFDADVDGDGVLNVNEITFVPRMITGNFLMTDIPNAENLSGSRDVSRFVGYPDGSIVIEFAGVYTDENGVFNAALGTMANFRVTGNVPVEIEITHGPGLASGTDGFVSVDGQSYVLTSALTDEFVMDINGNVYTVTRISGSTGNSTPFRWRSQGFASEVEFFSTAPRGAAYGLRIFVPVDSNGDGVPDFCDTDRDGDGVSDLVESGDATAIAADTDGDGSISVEEANDAGLTDNDGDGAWDQLNG